MSVPAEMRHVAHTAGGPEVLHVVTGPVPQPGPGEVLIRVEAAGVNRPDVQQRKGSYPPPPGASPLLGLEVAGEVAAVNGDTRWREGDKVCALVNGGGYAEYCTAPATQCLPWPAGYDAIRAAPCPRPTSRSGPTCSGSAASSPASARWSMAAPAASASPRSSSRTSSAAGCTQPPAARRSATPAYASAPTRRSTTRNPTSPPRSRSSPPVKGVDVVLDMVGGPYAANNLRCLGMDGRLVLIAFIGGSKVEQLDLTAIMVRRLTVTGSTMRPRTAAQKAAIADALREKVWPVLDAGRCGPVIYKVFPLDQAAEAHRLMESSTHIGKIMLQVA